MCRKLIPRIDLSGAVFLGQGHSGKVYLLPDMKVIKIFKDDESCIHECLILNSVRGNRHFPKVYECRGRYMIREYVSGICITDYISKHGLNPRLATNLIEMILDFKRLGFKRLDMRCAHIFVQPDESVMVIDPRNHYSEDIPYPKKMLNKLKQLKVAHVLMNILKIRYPELYYLWSGTHKKHYKAAN